MIVKRDDYKFMTFSNGCIIAEYARPIKQSHRICYHQTLYTADFTYISQSNTSVNSCTDMVDIKYFKYYDQFRTYNALDYNSSIFNAVMHYDKIIETNNKMLNKYNIITLCDTIYYVPQNIFDAPHLINAAVLSLLYTRTFIVDDVYLQIARIVLNLCKHDYKEYKLINFQYFEISMKAAIK